MKAYILCPLDENGKEHGGEGVYSMVLEDGRTMFQHFCSNITYAWGDLWGNREDRQKACLQMFGSDFQVLWLGTDEVTREELFKRHFEANFINLTRQIDNDEPPFLSYVQFVIWISAYYPAPSKMVSEKEFKANKETWYRFFREMKELQEKEND